MRIQQKLIPWPEILKAQLDRYPELDNDMKSLSEFTQKENC
jgi:hypothetical protein